MDSFYKENDLEAEELAKEEDSAISDEEAALAEDLLSKGYLEGQPIHRSTLQEIVGVTPEEDYLTVKVNRQRTLATLSAFSKLKKGLLKKGYDLQSLNHGGLYHLVPLEARAQMAVRDGTKGAYKAINNMTSRLMAIREPNKLSGESQRVRDFGLGLAAELQRALRVRRSS